LTNSIGAFPIVYIIVIFASYMYSLYYGLIMLKEIYAPVTEEEDEDYNFHNQTELLYLKIFVINEVVVGSIIAF
jgi:hypothetical protein